MQEYKRERSNLEIRLNEMAKTAAYHDEHLMVIDAWFSEVSTKLSGSSYRLVSLYSYASQLIDEIRLLVGDFGNHNTFSTFPSGLLAADSVAFNAHLKSRSSEISSAISQIFSRAPASTSEVSQLQGRVAELLAAEKVHIVELEKSRLEKEKLVGRLEDASLRYMLAEKKLDRSKSVTVAKLERQAISGGRSDTGSGLGGAQDASNGQVDSKPDNMEELIEAEEARKEAVAASAKRKEQLENLETENEKLTAQLTTLSNRLTHLSDDDYSRTDLFKLLRSQHEDVIKRINNLEATNVQLREEAEKLQAERTAYRIQVEKESAMAVSELEAQLVQAENDLARVRTGRDELIAEVTLRKNAQSQERNSVDQVKELASAKEERIKALESEVGRLKSQTAQTADPASRSPSAEDLSPEQLQSRYSNLEKQYSLLDNELQSMGTAFKKASTLASQKVTNAVALEEKVQRLSAEKSKADQKYFAAMKAKEAREQEVRTLRAQNSKSSEMVSSLKDSEAANRAIQVNLEKQTAEAKESVATVESKYRASQQQISERNIALEGLKLQIEELKKSLEAKDTDTSAKATANRKAEVEVEILKVRLDETKKSLESWKNKGLGNQSSEYEMLRVSWTLFPCSHNADLGQIMAICTVCQKNFKNTVIKTCGHVFCNECVEERTLSRSRKCPNCNRAFGLNDHLHITL